jgi:hypothetical protein
MLARIVDGPHAGATKILTTKQPPVYLDIPLPPGDEAWKRGGFWGDAAGTPPYIRYWIAFIRGDGAFAYGTTPIEDRARCMELTGSEDLKSPQTYRVKWNARPKR